VTGQTLKLQIRRIRSQRKEHQECAFSFFASNSIILFAQIGAFSASCSMPLGETLNSLKTQSRDWDSLQNDVHPEPNLSHRPNGAMGSNLELEAKRYSYVNVCHANIRRLSFDFS
jgi:hypothetical protein